MSTRKHYTDIEKRFCLNTLKKYKHVIEMKKSDCTTLNDKEEAWREIWNEFYTSTVITTTRTVKKLTKWWSNLKSDQRDALTAERQSRMATGGGPPAPSVDIDPEINAIISTVMATAPALFSLNSSLDEIENRRNAIGDGDQLVAGENATDVAMTPPIDYDPGVPTSSAIVDIADTDDIPKKKLKRSSQRENSEENQLKIYLLSRTFLDFGDGPHKFSQITPCLRTVPKVVPIIHVYRPF